MKFYRLILACFCLFFCSCGPYYHDYSEKSGFEQTEVDSMMLENLEVLGRVWGYVKYHHPIFADNHYDPDAELFELLPRIAKATSTERNRILTAWIAHFGSYDTTPERYESIASDPKRIEFHTDLSWIHDTERLGKDLSAHLVRLRVADRKWNYYALQWMREGWAHNPQFHNEKGYPNIESPDYGYRLLAVFRFWNMVEYFFPTKYLIDKNWNDVLKEYILRMAAPEDGDYRKEAWRMIAELHDNHAQGNLFWLTGNFRIPLDVGFVEDRLVVLSPDTLPLLWSERKVPFRPGDEIIEVGREPVKNYITRTRTFVPCSHEADVLRFTADAIMRTPKNTLLPIRYCRGGVLRDTLAVVEPEGGKYLKLVERRRRSDYRLLNENIAYLYPAGYAQTDSIVVEKILSKSEGLIIDMRCYPPHDFRTFIAKHVLPEKPECNMANTYPVIALPGIFHRETIAQIGRPYKKYDKPIVLLVNETTQSMAEYFVQAMQNNHRVQVIGSKTAGANGNVSEFLLPGGIKSRFSGLGWYYADGTPVQRQGVKIDHEIKPSVEGIAAGRDEVLEFAIRTINRGSRKSLKE